LEIKGTGIVGPTVFYWATEYSAILKKIKGKKQTPAEAAGFEFKLGSMFRLLKLINYAYALNLRVSWPIILPRSCGFQKTPKTSRIRKR